MSLLLIIVSAFGLKKCDIFCCLITFYFLKLYKCCHKFKYLVSSVNKSICLFLTEDSVPLKL